MPLTLPSPRLGIAGTVLFAGLAGITFAQAEDPPAALTRVVLDRMVHFRGSGAASVAVSPGIYRVEPAGKEQLQLLAEGQAPIVITATSQALGQEKIEVPLAVSLPDREETDLLHLVLLMPDGTGREAVGSFSGVFHRRIPVHMMVAVAKTLATGTPIQDLDALTRESGVTRRGGDYQTYRLPLGACHMLCYKDKQCRVFTWQQDPAKPGRGQCYLKNTVPNPVEDTCCVSGVKRAAGK